MLFVFFPFFLSLFLVTAFTTHAQEPIAQDINEALADINNGSESDQETQFISLDDIITVIQANPASVANYTDTITLIFSVEKLENNDPQIWESAVLDVLECLIACRHGALGALDSNLFIQMVCQTIQSLHSKCSSANGITGNVSFSFEKNEPTPDADTDNN